MSTKDGLSESFHPRRVHPEIALPDGPFPGPPGGQHGQNGAGVLRRQQVERPAHRPGLDEIAGRERSADVAGFDRIASDADGHLGRRRDLRLNAAQPAGHLGRRESTGGIQLVPAHPPREGLRPAHFDHDGPT